MEGVAIPLPCCDSSSDEEATQTEPEREKTDSVSGLTALRVEDALRAIVEGREHRASDKLLSLSYWREIGCQDGLHVLEIEPDEQPVYPAESIPKMRTSLLQRGYLMGDACVDADVLLRLSKGMKTLKRLGLAPTFIYVFDEAWVVLERCWRILAQMLDATDVVLEPSFFAHALSQPSDPAGVVKESIDVVRHTTLGGNFGLPHRDHSSSDCFTSDGRPCMLSVWCPLTHVSADNGCMHVLPQEFDELLHRPDHPHHLSPWDQTTGRCRFPIGGTVALAPCEAGSVLAWYGSLIHWGGSCSRYSEEEPRSSLTCTVRVRSAHPTQLQGLQHEELPQLTPDQLPLSLEKRVRYACANVLLFKWWYSVSNGVFPPHFLQEP